MSHELNAAASRVWGLLLADREDEIEESDLLAIQREAAPPAATEEFMDGARASRANAAEIAAAPRVLSATEALRAALVAWFERYLRSESTIFAPTDGAADDSLETLIGYPDAALVSPELTPDSGLDVERLARSMEVFAFPPASWPPNPSFMEEIAAEYARLSSADPSEESA